MKVLIVAPHCSTGGMPAYVERYMEHLAELGHSIHFSEFSNYSDEYTVQRDRIREAYPWSCHHNDEQSLLSLIGKGWDVVHFQEEPTSFLSPRAVSAILSMRHGFRFVLTSHELNLDYGKLPYRADRYVAVSGWQQQKIQEQVPDADVAVWTYPAKHYAGDAFQREMLRNRLELDSRKKHLVQVGLWTAHKRQHWTLEAARHLGEDWEVHFIGNQAPNMEAYWKPLELPPNCKVWGERDDVERIMPAFDAFVLPSSKELAPISLYEAQAAGLPCYVAPLETLQDWPFVHLLDMERPETLAKMLP